MTPDAANERVEQLLQRFRAGYEAGAPPHVGELAAELEPEARQELSSRIDSFLMDAPRRSWDPVAYEGSLAQASVDRVWESLEGVSGTWPELLPHLRKEARVDRRSLARRLAEALGFPGETQRVLEYYHRMEHGGLPADRVSDRVLAALAGIVGTSVERLRSAGRGGGEMAGGSTPAMARLAVPDPAFEQPQDVAADLSPAAPEAEMSREPDELDRLFLGGS